MVVQVISSTSTTSNGVINPPITNPKAQALVSNLPAIAGRFFIGPLSITQKGVKPCPDRRKS